MYKILNEKATQKTAKLQVRSKKMCTTHFPSTITLIRQ